MEKFYSDIDLRFQKHPITKDLIKLEDDDAVKASIKNIVLINKKEKRFDSFLGGNIRNYIFENMDSLYIETIKEDIISLIYKYDQRINDIVITNLSNLDNDDIFLSIVYKISNIPYTSTLDLIIKKIR